MARVPPLRLSTVGLLAGPTFTRIAFGDGRNFKDQIPRVLTAGNLGLVKVVVEKHRLQQKAKAMSIWVPSKGKRNGGCTCQPIVGIDGANVGWRTNREQLLHSIYICYWSS